MRDRVSPTPHPLRRASSGDSRPSSMAGVNFDDLLAAQPELLLERIDFVMASRCANRSIVLIVHGAC